MPSVEVIPYFPGVTGKILDLIVQDGAHWGIHACQTFTVGYNLPTGADPPADTIPALTSAVVLSVGAMNGRMTFDPTIGNWVVATAPGTGLLLATPLEEIGSLPTLLPYPFYSILQWVERGVVRPWQWTISSPLPPGTKGDLLYFDGTAWVLRHIADGNQGDFLMNDRSNSGLPIWQPVTSTTPQGTGVGVPGTLLIGSSTGAARVLSLWNGSTNNAPPEGWTSPGFDDSTWPAATVLPGNPQSSGPNGFPLVGGQGYLSATSTGISPSGNAQFLVRQHFRPPSPVPTFFYLTVSEDNNAVGLVNGSEVYAYNRPSTDTAPAHQVRFDTRSILALDDNVLCFFITDQGTTGDAYGVSYALSYT